MTRSRRSIIRRSVALGAGGLIAGAAGCLGEPVGDVDGTIVSNEADSIAVTELHSWAAGTFTRYRGAIVVRGTLANTDDDPVETPSVSVTFLDARGTILSELEATVRLPPGEARPDEPVGETIDPAQTVVFVTSFEPGEETVDRFDLSIS